jgi:hypothetical protein
LLLFLEKEESYQIIGLGYYLIDGFPGG